MVVKKTIATWYDSQEGIDYLLWLDTDTDRYTLSMNGQAHLPIAPEKVDEIIASVDII